MARDPDILVDLTTARTEFEAETIAEALRAQGIPAQTFATAGTVLQWDVAVSQPIRVAVRRRDLEEAKAILRAIRAESVDLDWSEVDTGDRTPVTERERRESAEQRVRLICRRCNYDVTGLALGGNCPECGAKLDDPWPVREARPGPSPASAFVTFVVIQVIVSLAAWGAGVYAMPWGRLSVLQAVLIASGLTLLVCGYRIWRHRRQRGRSPDVNGGPVDSQHR